ncbi:MAG: DUF1648 domain-containing protein, partial [Propionibacterium sp.]|nr:DUF1648 domain-containing protein [Propionibacterium sp.]
WATRGNYPESVAVHWGANGQPDGWMSLSAALLTSTITLTFLCCLMVGIGVLTKSIAIMTPVTVGMAVALGLVIHGSIFAQAGDEAPVIGPFLFAGVVTWIVIGVVGYRWLKPRILEVPPGATGTFTPSLPGHPENRHWRGRTRGGAGMWVGAVLVGAVGIFLAAMIGLADPWLTAAILLLTVGVAPLILSALQEITVDEGGLTGRFLGFRATHIPLAAIRSAGVVEVQALGEYGGVGSRTAVDGLREGLVTSSGEALIVERDGLKDFVITVDDAHSAARVLAMLLAERA